MPTITAFTTVNMTNGEKEKLMEEIGIAVEDAFGFPPMSKCFMMVQVPKENACETSQDQSTIIVWTAPGKTVAQRRKMHRNINEAFVKALGYRGPMKIITIIKDHDPINVGIDGVLRSDLN